MSTTSTIAPSRIARFAAAKEWPEVQSQKRVAPGVYRFSCAGHGGLVAVLPAAERVLDPQGIEAARATGRLVEVAVLSLGRANQWLYGPEYSTETWAALKVDPSYADRLTVTEVWIGEEDGEYATLHLVSQAVRDGDDFGPERRAEYEAAGYHKPGRAHAVCERWQPDFLDAYESRSDYRSAFEAKLAAATIPFAGASGNGLDDLERSELDAYCELAADEHDLRREWLTSWGSALSHRCFLAGRRAA